MGVYVCFSHFRVICRGGHVHNWKHILWSQAKLGWIQVPFITASIIELILTSFSLSSLFCKIKMVLNKIVHVKLLPVAWHVVAPNKWELFLLFIRRHCRIWCTILASCLSDVLRAFKEKLGFWVLGKVHILSALFSWKTIKNPVRSDWPIILNTRALIIIENYT